LVGAGMPDWATATGMDKHIIERVTIHPRNFIRCSARCPKVTST